MAQPPRKNWPVRLCEEAKGQKMSDILCPMGTVCGAPVRPSMVNSEHAYESASDTLSIMIP